MTKVLQATERGQVTLPKSWRDQFKTQYFVAEITTGQIVLKPLQSVDFEDSLNKAWDEYKNGDYVPHEKLMNK